MRVAIYTFFLVIISIRFACLANLKLSEEKLDEQIENLISKMTLDEKIGQMTQVTLEVISKPRQPATAQIELDSVRLREALLKYHVGSILNIYGRAATLENWNRIITQIQDVAIKESRLGIPVIYGIDAIHGANYVKGATLFPQNIAMAATFNQELVYKSAVITALEMRAAGIPLNFNPVLGVARNPAWPRLWETFGEDPYLVTELGKSYIKGMQGHVNGFTGTKAAACMKHFLGYSFPLNGLDRTPAWIPERILRDIFLPPFKAAVDAGVATVMINSSEINGIPVHSDYNIVTNLLRNELGFRGVTVSDWGDIKSLYTRDRVADSPEEAVRMGVMAGVDMSMVAKDFSFAEILVKLVKENKVPISRIDEAVSRILRIKFRTGLFDNAYPDTSLNKYFASREAEMVNVQAARESITLLKNNKNILPLKKNIKVFVTGPNADLVSTLNGGWSTTWQGGVEESYPEKEFTILEAVEDKIGTNNVLYFYDSAFTEPVDFENLSGQVREVDAILLCLGEKSYCEGSGNISDINLPRKQIEMAKALYETGKPVILVLVEGRPRIIREIVNDAAAVIMAYLPGMKGGKAMAEVLFGDVNPSGKLPFTYPYGPNGYSTYDRKPIESRSHWNYSEEYPFGFGLSYTTFSYSNLKLNKNTFKMDEDIEISINVKNSGQRPGKETVLLFGTDVYGSVSRPVKQLKRFNKLFLDSGEEKSVHFTLTASDFAFTGRDNNKIIEPGLFRIAIGNQTSDFVLLQE